MMAYRKAIQPIRRSILNTRLAHLAWLLCVLWALEAHAGTFDCSVVYDEYDQLMAKEYFAETSSYGEVKSGSMNYHSYERLQRGKFTLFPNRESYAPVVLHTNGGLSGKALIDWTLANSIKGKIRVIDAVLYIRWADGYGGYLRPALELQSGDRLDLDSMRVFPELAEDPNKVSDLLVLAESEVLALQQINGAELIFPLESLCR